MAPPLPFAQTFSPPPATLLRHDGAALPASAVSQFEPESTLLATHANREITAAMARLPADQRHVVELKLFQGFTFEDIAGQLGISPNTAKTRLYAALEKLRRDDVLTMQARARVWHDLAAPPWNPQPAGTAARDTVPGWRVLVQWFPQIASTTALLLAAAVYWSAPLPGRPGPAPRRPRTRRWVSCWRPAAPNGNRR